MAGGDFGVEREIELAEAAAAAPGAKLLADGEGLGLHGGQPSAVPPPNPITSDVIDSMTSAGDDSGINRERK